MAHRVVVGALVFAALEVGVVGCSDGADESGDEAGGEPGAAGEQGNATGGRVSAGGEGGAGDAPGAAGAADGGAESAAGGAGDGGGSGGAAGAGSEPAEGGAGPGGGALPAELAGVWQQTRASAGDYENGFGQDFSLTTGFSVELKLAENGAFRFSHFASGASSSCGAVSQFDQAVGAAVLEGSSLVLYPAERRIDVMDCAGTQSLEPGTEPIVFELALGETRHFHGGLRTSLMQLEGGPHPLELTLLHREPVAEPEQPPQPDDFTLGDDGPFAELQGLWVPQAGTDSEFLDVVTGDYYFPELNGSPHQWIRFAGTEYESAVALQNINAEGVCKSDVIYYERGEARFAVLEDVGGQGTHFVGDNRLEATAALLIVRVRECDENDGVVGYELVPTTGYYDWIYFTPESSSESLSLGCIAPFSEWQHLLCTDEQQTFVRRE